MDTMVLPPTEKEALAASVAKGNPTRAAIGMKLREYRDTYGVSRRLLAETAGVSKTVILRIENGQQSPSLYSLTHIIIAARQIVQTLHPRRVKGMDRWMWDMLLLAGEDARVVRDRHRRAARRASTVSE